MSSSTIDMESDHGNEFEEKRVTRKIDLRLLPVLCSLCLLSRLNGVNIGNARLGGLERDLQLSPEEYQWCLSVFYLGFVMFQIPSNIMLRRWRPSKWIPLVASLWGIVAVSMAGVTGFKSLFLCRFLLGSLQCSFSPGFLYYISLWYQKRQQALRFGSIWAFSALAGAFGGFLAYAIGHIKTEYLSQWQLIFVIQGTPTIILAIICWFYLPDGPEEASFLTEKERKIVLNRLAQDTINARDQSFSWSQVCSVFTDWKIYLFALLQINGSIPIQGISLFLPTLIHSMGQWTPLQTQLMTIPPYLTAFFAILLIARSSDQFIERSWHLIATNAISASGLLILIFVDMEYVHIRYLAIILLTSGVYATVSIRAAWANNNFASLTRRAIAAAFITSFSASGGLISSHMYHEKHKPRYRFGYSVSLTCIAIQATVALSLRFVFTFINHRRSQMSDKEMNEQIEYYGGSELVGDRHPKFRYTL